MTFINNGSSAVALQNTTITDANGIAVTFNGPIAIPAINPSFIVVTGFAVNAGSAGNIPQFDIVKACCAANIVVKNTTAFTGGQDAQPNSKIQQSDIDSAANVLSGTLTQRAQTNLQRQVMSNERVVDGSLHCQPNITSDHLAGDVAKTVTVTVTTTCGEEVYDDQTARTLATSLLQARSGSDPNLGTGYALIGQVALSETVVNAEGRVTVQVQTRRLWAYRFSTARLHQLSSQIADKGQIDARALLL